MIVQPKDFVDQRFRLAHLLESAPWQFAVTMPTIPHEYSQRRKWYPTDEGFNDAVRMIREYGYDNTFRGRPYLYWDCNGYHHWTMGAPVEQTEIINRAKKQYATVYDDIANVYDSLYSDDASVRESRDVIEMAGDVSGRVLDIGCGTGLLLEFKEVGEYVGIDISAAMLHEFRRKFPDHPGRTMRCSFEDYYGTGFSNIIALFGAANYIDQKHLNRIPQMLAPGGSAFLMFYRPDYYPVAYAKTGAQRPQHNQYVPQDGDEEFGKYMIRRIKA